MKKILVIVILGLLFSSNAYAEKITQICKDIRTSPVLKSFTLTLDKNARTVTGEQVYTDEFLNKHNISTVTSWTRVYEITSINDLGVKFYFTNYKRWEDNHNWVATTGQGSNKYWNVYNPKSLKKLRKKEGPDDWKVIEAVWNFNVDGNPLKQIHNKWSKKGYEQDIKTDQFICYSKAQFVKKNKEEKQQKITKASNQMKQEIKPFKQMCRNIGYSEGTEKFADCVKDLYLKKLDSENQSQMTTSASKPKRNIDPSVWDDLFEVSQDLLGGKSISESLGGVSSSSGTRKITCFKTGEETGGLNKICRYDCVGNLVTTTVGAAQMCPIQIQR